MMSFEKGQVTAALSAAISQTFEGIAFAEPESFEEISEMPVYGNTHRLATLNLEPTFPAVMGLEVPRNFLSEIILATIDEDSVSASEEMCIDLISELSNTIAGLFLKILLPPEEEIRFGLPEYLSERERTSPPELKKNDIVLKITIEANVVHCFLAFKSDK